MEESQLKLNRVRKARSVTVLVDANAGTRMRSGRIRLDKDCVEHQVHEALGQAGYEARVLPLKASIVQTLRELEATRPDVICNLVEQFDGDRKQDMAITAMLDLVKIPYTGADPACLRLCRDKALSKLVVANAGVATPHFVTDPRKAPASLLVKGMLVKPRFSDASEGLIARSLVSGPAALREQVSRLLEKSLVPVICEQFIRGREVFVSVIGERNPFVLPPRMVHFRKEVEPGKLFCTERIKLSDKHRAKNDIRYPRARFGPQMMKRVREAAACAYTALGMRDYGRIDFRIGRDDTVYFLEANPNPDLSRASFGRVASWSGISYQELVTHLVECAHKRRRAGLVQSGPSLLQRLD